MWRSVLRCFNFNEMMCDVKWCAHKLCVVWMNVVTTAMRRGRTFFFGFSLSRAHLFPNQLLCFVMKSRKKDGNSGQIWSNCLHVRLRLCWLSFITDFKRHVNYFFGIFFLGVSDVIVTSKYLKIILIFGISDILYLHLKLLKF